MQKNKTYQVSSYILQQLRQHTTFQITQIELSQHLCIPLSTVKRAIKIGKQNNLYTTQCIRLGFQILGTKFIRTSKSLVHLESSESKNLSTDSTDSTSLDFFQKFTLFSKDIQNLIQYIHINFDTSSNNPSLSLTFQKLVEAYHFSKDILSNNFHVRAFNYHPLKATLAMLTIVYNKKLGDKKLYESYAVKTLIAAVWNYTKEEFYQKIVCRLKGWLHCISHKEILKYVPWIPVPVPPVPQVPVLPTEVVSPTGAPVNTVLDHDTTNTVTEKISNIIRPIQQTFVPVPPVPPVLPTEVAPAKAVPPDGAPTDVAQLFKRDFLVSLGLSHLGLSYLRSSQLHKLETKLLHIQALFEYFQEQGWDAPSSWRLFIWAVHHTYLLDAKLYTIASYDRPSKLFILKKKRNQAYINPYATKTFYKMGSAILQSPVYQRLISYVQSDFPNISQWEIQDYKEFKNTSFPSFPKLLDTILSRLRYDLGIYAFKFFGCNYVMNLKIHDNKGILYVMNKLLTK